MTTKNVRGVKIVMGPNGKPTLKRVRPFMAGAKSRKAARLEKAWKGKGK
jgi:hypothetical protein